MRTQLTIPDLQAQDADMYDKTLEDAAYRKITWRVVPILFIGFVFNYMDRTNIGFAKLQMSGDLGFTDAAYGLGAGILFISYALFAVPSNLLMEKIGARLTILGCLTSWGLLSTATMFVRTPHEFYIIRFLLGISEAGFFPGILFYFTTWYPSHRRASATGIFQSATVVAGVISGILSAALMTYLNGYCGLRGWQWMFAVEGLPCVVLGILTYFILDNRPDDAKWLTDAEKRLVLRALQSDPATSSGHHTMQAALKDWRVYVLGIVFFLSVIGTYVLAFWQPSIIHSIGVSSVMTIGLLSTIPSIAAVVSKIGIGYRSDKKKELRWHFAVPAIAGALGLLLLPAFPHNIVFSLACLTLATAGVHGCIPVFWSVPGLYLSGTAAAAGIALISTIGNTAGAVGPYALGLIKTQTGSFEDGLYIMAGLLSLSAVLILLMVSKSQQQTAHLSEDGPGLDG
jgi:sugar phosphate permease